MSLAQELQRMHALKEAAAEVGRKKKAADAEYKQQQNRCLEQMQINEAESFRTDGVLYTAIADRIKGSVDDRRRFVRWALENDESIQEFLYGWSNSDEAFTNAFYDAITNTEMVRYVENGHAVNSLAKACVDDESNTPPGLTFRPDPYIQQRTA